MPLTRRPGPVRVSTRRSLLAILLFLVGATTLTAARAGAQPAPWTGSSAPALSSPVAPTAAPSSGPPPQSPVAASESSRSVPTPAVAASAPSPAATDTASPAAAAPVQSPFASARRTATPAFKSPAIMPLFASYAVLQGFDAHSTLAVIHAGGAEANSLVAPFVARPAAFIAFKTGMTVLTLYSASRLWTRNRVAAIALMAATNTAYALIARHNYRLADTMKR